MSRPYDSIIYKLPSSLKITDFWPQYIEALSEELDIELDELIENSYLINDPYCTYNDYLLNLASKFGYTPNLIINNSVEFLQREVLSIPYRIRHKGTYKGYKFNFKQIERLGEIYNFYYNKTKFIKAVNWDSIYIKLDSLTVSGLSLPFTDIIPDINYSIASSSDLVKLDTGRTLDEYPIPWTLDNQLFSVPTKHLGIEYYVDRLVTKSGNVTEYSIYDDYLKYLDVGTEYNRRNIVYPHCGTNLAMILGNDGRYNSFVEHISTTSAYTIPDIKLKGGVTLSYLNLTSSGINEDTIKYASVGTGIRSLPDSNTVGLFNPNNMVLAYSFDDLDYSSFILDHSKNDFTTIVSGTSKKIDSILGRSVNFNGSTYCEGYNIVVPNSNNSYFLWFNPVTYASASKTVGTLFDSPVLRLQYNYQNSSLIVNTTSGTTICTSSGVSSLVDHNVVITQSGLSITLFIDGIQASQGSLTSYSGVEGTFTIGSKINYDDTYIGKLDSFIITNQILASGLISDSYSKRIGLINSVQKIEYTTPINLLENSHSNNWLCSQTYFPANCINNEYLFTTNSGVDTYLGTLKVDSLIPYYLSIRYHSQTGNIIYDYEAKDDGNGNIVGDYLSGTIDYSTGDYIIYPYKTNNVYQKVISTTSISGISQFLNYNIQKNSLLLFYTITSTSYVAMDDGNGNVIGTGISSGTIDYVTGQLSVTFSQATQIDYYTTTQYIYQTKLTLSQDKSYVEADYRTYNNMDITEITFEDKNKNALAYATFPPINFYSIFNHASFAMLIKQTTIS